MEIKKQITQSLLVITRHPDSILVTMGTHQKTVGTREQCSGYHFETISKYTLQWTDSREGGWEGGDGTDCWSCSGGRWLDCIRALAVERQGLFPNCFSNSKAVLTSLYLK